ncbi:MULTISPECIES: helix-turn-helix domain-containing protein [Bacillus]|uniref:helix-turn-helix domain-containing protein n=1 Tax=Bacillus TaxID=1386 RepID=UPI00053B3239|nr:MULTISPECIES: helix-turn-helix domain-containing protein [Bacillus]AMK73957.1 XRE family transcriptional regulator [Bacillus subtilis subsp. natto]API43668.1 transcriptional regulator [Bacillus subtilis]API97222.1 transcriptional regulator [Bacillus subtilis]ARI86082.1 transcriptional regulator [Bacillus subtilis]AVL04450.1 transcriptional regulator [Bacillus subtilis]
MARKEKIVNLKPTYHPLEVTLAKRKKNKTDLRNDLGISSSTLAKMTAGEFVALKVIAQICEYLDCPIEEVVQFERRD